MEEMQPKIGKYALNFGLLLGLVSVVFNVMLFSVDMHYEQTPAIQIIGISILFALVFIGITQFRKANGGYLKLGEALKLGTGIAVVGAVIGLIYYFLLTNVIEPGFMDKASEFAKVKAFENNPKLTQEQWDQGMEMQKKFAWIAYPFILIFQALIGLIAGLVAGLIFKKDKPAY
ncbi:MAG: DUF4199 domain-containing protein [Croceitalea sp.]|nr:DUF4199 domain-containing protein [Croceitalea sp.]MBT8238405.1 DUF4199 domain-containing protein [Croceitalea sp.]NNC35063.1 DUF4199 domain-containing protein [Croceitalea sp.]NNL08944.1 DUF4199 domain-containing protein [Croceitalea sp.]NNM17721.1 DUF4199 domain-containing protein [Croceitalea sp.]